MKKILSPSGRYELTVRLTKKVPQYWQWSSGKVIDLEKERVVAMVHRDYPHFPFCWVEGHPDGHDYLVCGEHYQAYTIIQLDTGLRRDWMDISGTGFCFVEIDWEADEPGELNVYGCYWGSPFENYVYDFRNPMDLPLPVISRAWDDQEPWDDDEEEE